MYRPKLHLARTSIYPSDPVDLQPKNGTSSLGQTVELMVHDHFSIVESTFDDDRFIEHEESAKELVFDPITNAESSGRPTQDGLAKERKHLCFVPEWSALLII